MRKNGVALLSRRGRYLLLEGHLGLMRLGGQWEGEDRAHGLQLKGAEEEVEPVHGETGTLRDNHTPQATETNTNPTVGTTIS